MESLKKIFGGGGALENPIGIYEKCL